MNAPATTPSGQSAAASSCRTDSSCCCARFRVAEGLEDRVGREDGIGKLEELVARCRLLAARVSPKQSRIRWATGKVGQVGEAQREGDVSRGREEAGGGGGGAVHLSVSERHAR